MGGDGAGDRSTLAMLSPATIDLLAEGLRRFDSPDRARFLGHSLRGSRATPSGATRQARHARLARGRTTAVVSALALAPREKDFAALMLRSDFARLRPNSAQHHAPFLHLALQKGAFSLVDAQALWELALPPFFDLTAKIHQVADEQAIVLGSIVAQLLVGPLFHGVAFADEWQALWGEAHRRGALRNPFVRLQLCVMGSFVGRSGPHVDWLMDGGTRRFELDDAFALVRRDLPAGLLRRDAAAARGVLHEVALDHRSRSGRSNLNHLASYVRSCLRNPHHFYSEGHALMLLTWAGELSARYRSLRTEGVMNEEVVLLFETLNRIERVQSIEKSRFFSIWDRMPATPARTRLSELWHRSLTTESVGPQSDLRPRSR